MSDEKDELASLRSELNRLSFRVQALEERQQSPLTNQTVGSTSSAVQGAAGTWILPLINRVGAFTLLLGVIFFFKYAVDESLLNAQAGCILVLFFGLLLLVAGEWLQRKSYFVPAQGITGCGLATVFTTVYAAHIYYLLLPKTVTFLGLLTTCIAAVVLSFRYRSPAIAGVGIFGALWAPLLLRQMTDDGDTVLALLYFICIVLAASFVAQRLQSVVMPPMLAAVALLCASIQFGPHRLGSTTVFSAVLALAQFSAAKRSVLLRRTQAAFLVAGHLAVLIAAVCVIKLQLGPASLQSELGSVFLACYGVGLLLFGFLQTSTLNKTLGSVCLGAVVAKLYLFDIWNLPRIYRVSAFVGLGALLLVASYLFSRSDLRSSSQAKS